MSIAAAQQVKAIEQRMAALERQIGAGEQRIAALDGQIQELRAEMANEYQRKRGRKPNGKQEEQSL